MPGINKQNTAIDMALVADEFCHVPTGVVKLFMKAMLKYYMVHPQTYNTKDFSPDKNPFVAEILKTGIEIEWPNGPTHSHLHHECLAARPPHRYDQ